MSIAEFNCCTGSCALPTKFGLVVALVASLFVVACSSDGGSPAAGPGVPVVPEWSVVSSVPDQNTVGPDSRPFGPNAKVVLPEGGPNGLRPIVSGTSWTLSASSMADAGYLAFSGPVVLVTSCRAGLLRDFYLTVPSWSSARIGDRQTGARWWIDKGLDSEIAGRWELAQKGGDIHDDLRLSQSDPRVQDLLTAKTLTIELGFFPRRNIGQEISFSMKSFGRGYAYCQAAANAGGFGGGDSDGAGGGDGDDSGSRADDGDGADDHDDDSDAHDDDADDRDDDADDRDSEGGSSSDSSRDDSSDRDDDGESHETDTDSGGAATDRDYDTDRREYGELDGQGRFISYSETAVGDPSRTLWTFIHTRSRQARVGSGPFSGPVALSIRCEAGQITEYLLTVPARSGVRLDRTQASVSWRFANGNTTERGTWASPLYSQRVHDSVQLTVAEGPSVAALTSGGGNLDIDLVVYPHSPHMRTLRYSMTDFGQAFSQCGRRQTPRRRLVDLLACRLDKPHQHSH